MQQGGGEMGELIPLRWPGATQMKCIYYIRDMADSTILKPFEFAVVSYKNLYCLLRQISWGYW
ncbi:hypothetical protein RG47T_0250 [Mucilaginibacter polytrichastri]|uniref:Uncharacterized protein n=1 Tax=Mucilaginibacter polytrichastri TaxID=1302689 RepID=A0A1Q5ZSR6_9SPHI|nr:hypothetical protein RG47T_0250 [Mucilaginibacter polytrichastri]SFS49075.1 hypothetical protein SAMN04487890_101822 [Mucilaginibacter polytrichastri]